MGGRVGLKGTDGVANEAQAAGAEPIAGPRAQLFARTFLELSKHDESLRVRWQTCGRAMGAAPLRGAGVREETIEVVHTPGERTTADDTRRGVDACIGGGAELLLFCGGGGTAPGLPPNPQKTKPKPGKSPRGEKDPPPFSGSPPGPG